MQGTIQDLPNRYGCFYRQGIKENGVLTCEVDFIAKKVYFAINGVEFKKNSQIDSALIASPLHFEIITKAGGEFDLSIWVKDIILEIKS